ncbi:hypothetical protein Desti_4463 [Desulfomonile tiedjei DSM 6799]|uniref:Uncharacterized protein n=1 Tax=Desulfomonile tiedjei (strain ATCC 49306 / DSM 6799 / DCB-1) TaxID=706587 RepID=I4CC04_DESTA|nr:hypothetical protein Desti_4463 [Desulfomonile tiedjei DSM 6799]
MSRGRLVRTLERLSETSLKRPRGQLSCPLLYLPLQPLILILKSLILLLLNPLELLLICLILLMHLTHSFLLLPYEHLLTLMFLSDSFLLHPLVHVRTCRVGKQEEYQTEQRNTDDCTESSYSSHDLSLRTVATSLYLRYLFRLYHKTIENAEQNIKEEDIQGRIAARLSYGTHEEWIAGKNLLDAIGTFRSWAHKIAEGWSVLNGVISRLCVLWSEGYLQPPGL